MDKEKIKEMAEKLLKDMDKYSENMKKIYLDYLKAKDKLEKKYKK
jgi:hypothetical protein